MRFDIGSSASAAIDVNVRVRREMQNRDFPAVILILGILPSIHSSDIGISRNETR
jgi:hypothetical protein